MARYVPILRRNEAKAKKLPREHQKPENGRSGASGEGWRTVSPLTKGKIEP